MCDVLGEAKAVTQEEKGMLLFELPEKTTEVSHATKLGDLHEEIETTQEKEVLSILHEDSKAQEEALSMLDSLKKSLEAEKIARLETITALDEAKQRGEKDLNALSKERNKNTELQSALGLQQEEVSRLVKEGSQREQVINKLKEQIDDLTVKLEASQHQVGPKLQEVLKSLF